MFLCRNHSFAQWALLNFYIWYSLMIQNGWIYDFLLFFAVFLWHIAINWLLFVFSKSLFILVAFESKVTEKGVRFQRPLNKMHLLLSHPWFRNFFFENCGFILRKFQFHIGPKYMEDRVNDLWDFFFYVMNESGAIYARKIWLQCSNFKSTGEGKTYRWTN